MSHASPPGFREVLHISNIFDAFHAESVLNERTAETDTAAVLPYCFLDWSLVVGV